MVKRKIGIDAGHMGAVGADRGAMGNGVIEADLNLAVALKFRDKLIKDGRFEPILTRDKAVSNQDITAKCNILNKAGVEIAFSVHHNSGPSSANGVEVLCTVTNSPQSVKLAELAVDKLAKGLGMVKRPTPIVRRKNSSGGDYYGMIRQTKMPLIISEGGFVSNVSDASKMKAPDFAEKQAEALYQTVLEFYGLKAPEQPKPVVKPVVKPAEKPKEDLWYRVVAGSYRDRKYAEDQIEALKKAGFNAFIDIKK